MILCNARAQIDQQAAESLKKNEKSQIDELNFDHETKTGVGLPLNLKDQLKKKTQENIDFHGKLSSDPTLKILSLGNNKNESSSSSSNSISNSPKEVVGTPKSSPKPKATLTDSDWTQLLSTPSQPTTSGAPVRGNGHSGIRGLRKDGRKQAGVASVSVGLEGRRNQNQKIGSSVSKPVRRTNSVEGKKLNGKASDGDESGFSDSARRSSGVEMQRDGGKFLEGRELDHKEVRVRPLLKPNDKGNEHNGSLNLKSSLRSVNKNPIPQPELVSGVGKLDGVSDVKTKMADDRDHLGSARTGKHEFNNVASRSSTSDDLKRSSSSMSYGSSESGSDSGSSSDSEDERQREERRRRREKILAERAAAKAVEAIKERENMVARLEGEKQSLEKILEEQTKQQAQEVTYLVFLVIVFLITIGFYFVDEVGLNNFIAMD